MESFTLGPTPKIDFTRTVDHTLATARELADLQISINTLSKHYEILY
jgi:DNA-binding transcriptional regulator YhcF (GntR family)